MWDSMTKTPPRKPTAADSLPLELSIELVDAAGTAARLPLGRYGVVRRPIEEHPHGRSVAVLADDRDP